MGFHRRPPNNNVTLPLVGGKYRLKPDSSGQWVEVVSIQNGQIRVRGLDRHIMDQLIPDWRFDDMVHMLPDPPVVHEPEPEVPDDDFMLLAEDGVWLLTEGGELLLLEESTLEELLTEDMIGLITEDGELIII